VPTAPPPLHKTRSVRFATTLCTGYDLNDPATATADELHKLLNGAHWAGAGEVERGADVRRG